MYIKMSILNHQIFASIQFIFTSDSILATYLEINFVPWPRESHFVTMGISHSDSNANHTCPVPSPLTESMTAVYAPLTYQGLTERLTDQMLPSPFLALLPSTSSTSFSRAAVLLFLAWSFSPWCPCLQRIWASLMNRSSKQNRLLRLGCTTFMYSSTQIESCASVLSYPPIQSPPSCPSAFPMPMSTLIHGLMSYKV